MSMEIVTYVNNQFDVPVKVLWVWLSDMKCLGLE